MDRLEESVRSALRSTEAHPDVEEFLHRVHRGATRRRRRQRLTGAGVLAAAAAVAGVVLTALPLHGPRPAPYAAPPSAHRPAAGSAAVLSVSASSPHQWWVLDTVPCRRFGGCALVSGTAMTRSVRVPAPTAKDSSPTADTVQQVRFAVDGTDGWLFGGALWSTHDGGVSWQRVHLPAGTRVQSLGAYGGQVYAVTTDQHGRAGMLTSRTDTDDWIPGRLPRGISVSGTRLALSRQVRAFPATTRRSPVVVVSRDGGRTWQLTSSPCGTAELAATGTSVWATCPAAADGAVYTSTDGRSWRRVGAVPLGEGAELAPISDQATLVYLGREVRRVDAEGVSDAGPPLLPGEQIRYIGFNDPAHGFLVTTSGRLLTSADAGQTWIETHQTD